MSRHGILVPYYAHTATKPDGTPDPDESKWQRLDKPNL